MEEFVSVSQLRQKAASVLRNAANGKPCIVISRSKPVAVILSPKKYEEMQERLRELERAEIIEAVKLGEREYRAGRTKRLRSLKDLR